MNQFTLAFVFTISLFVMVSCNKSDKQLPARLVKPTSVISETVPVSVKSWSIPENFNGAKAITLGNRFISNQNTVVYNNFALVFGGSYVEMANDESFRIKDMNDIVTSYNLKNWYHIAEELITPMRLSYAVCNYNNSLLIYGGRDYNIDPTEDGVRRNDMIILNPDDVFKTANIYNLPNRDEATIIQYDDSIIIIGGIEHNRKLNSVIKVKNNIVVSNSFFPNYEVDYRANFQAWVFHDTLFVTDSLGNFWKSQDGANWEKIKVETDYHKSKIGYTIIVRGEYWYLLGGFTGVSDILDGEWDDVWASNNEGRNWILLSNFSNKIFNSMMYSDYGGVAENSFTPRHFAAGFVLNGKLIIGGGYYASKDKFLQDFWSSDDGITWTELK